MNGDKCDDDDNAAAGGAIGADADGADDNGGNITPSMMRCCGGCELCK